MATRQRSGMSCAGETCLQEANMSRLLVDCLISASVILLAGIVYNTTTSEGMDDLRLVLSIVTELAALLDHGNTGRLQNVWSNCTELLRAARAVLGTPNLILQHK